MIGIIDTGIEIYLHMFSVKKINHDFILCSNKIDLDRIGKLFYLVSVH